MPSYRKSIAGSSALFLVSWSLLLSGCGGGGNTGPPTPPAPTITTVAITPSGANLVVGQTQQFTATVQGTGDFNKSVAWSVNEVVGGNATAGTISGNGLYAAPGSVPLPNLVSIKAVSVANAGKSDAASVTIEDAGLRENSTFLESPQTETVVVAGRTVQAAKDQVLIYLREDVTRSELEGLKVQIRNQGGSLIGSLLETRTLQVSIPSTASE